METIAIKHTLKEVLKARSIFLKQTKLLVYESGILPNWKYLDITERVER